MFSDMSHLSIVKTDVQPGVPVRTAVAEFLSATRRNRTAESQKNYHWMLYSFADFAETQGISLEAVDGRTVDGFLDHYQASHRPSKPGATTIAASSLANMVTVIKAFLNWCAHDTQVYGDFVEEKTVRAIRRVKVPKVIIEVFSHAQIRALLESSEQEESPRMVARAKVIIHVLVGTGIRASEFCHLKLCDTHLQNEGPYIKVVAGKGERDRRVPLGPVTYKKLAYWTQTYRAEQPVSAPVFTNRSGVEAISVPGLQQLFGRLGERAKIEGVRCSPHTARHTFACNCIKSGMSIYNLSKLLGHSSVVMTERYCRALGADFQELADQVRGQLR